ncbi:MAG: FkbM family methyltransferase [Spirochaetales bacterium]
MTWIVAHSAFVLIFSTLLLMPRGGAGVGLHPAGLLLAAEAAIAFFWLVARVGVARRGVANLVTGLRTLAAIGMLASLAFPFLATEWAWALFVVAIVAALTDFADGRIARRAGNPTAFGATFDMESDALLLLSLSLVAVRFYGLPWWVSVAGLIRYATAVPFLVLPEPAFPRWFSQLVKSSCAISAVLLIVAIVPAGFFALPFLPQLRLAASATAVALLAASFSIEAVLRVRARADLPPRTPGELRGVLRSVLIYHGVPFRHFSIRRFYRRFVTEGQTAVDVGAHVGNRVAALRSLGVTVVAVEPQPRFVTLLGRLFADDRGVVIVGAACGAEVSTSRLRVSSAHPTLSTLSESWTHSIDEHFQDSGVRWDRELEVPTTTLDSLIEQYGEPAFIKVDVEGFEPEVLAGLSRPVRAISVEFLPAAIDRAVESLQAIEHLGSYRYNYSMVETMRFASPTWLTAAELETILRAMPPNGASGDIYALRAEP